MGCLLTPAQFDAALFDLDGVVTDTASIHAICWQRMFNEFLTRYNARTSQSVVPFDIASDYPRFVDGKPRLDGVRGFLTGRGIKLPEGGRGDPPGGDTVYQLGERKNALFNDVLDERGVTVYDGSVVLIRELQRVGIGTAVVTSSRNCSAVLHKAGLTDLFQVQVDGVVRDQLGLPGKPAPDTFVKAARDLGADRKRSVVFEDAYSGVAAGRAGGFALVVGVDRKGTASGLLEHGAHLVVRDLADLLTLDA